MKSLTDAQKKEIASARRLHEAGAVPDDMRALGIAEGAIRAVLQEAFKERYVPVTCGEH